jgi:hypothetical protein
MHAAKKYGEKDWQLLRFFQQDHCTNLDGKVASGVQIGNFSPPNLDIKFEVPEIQCDKIAMPEDLCRHKGGPRGKGDVGIIAHDPTDKDFNRWAKVFSRTAAYSSLNPFIEWQSIGTWLAESKDLPEPDKVRFVASYRALASRAADVSYDDLVAFNELLAITPGAFQDGRIYAKQCVNDFRNGTEAKKTYSQGNPYPAFSVLIHEVGHQFGMDHADNPAPDSLTGSIQIGQDMNGNPIAKFTTKDSVMATGRRPMYLTADDQRGIQVLAERVASLVMDHLPKGPKRK